MNFRKGCNKMCCGTYSCMIHHQFWEHTSRYILHILLHHHNLHTAWRCQNRQYNLKRKQNFWWNHVCLHTSWNQISATEKRRTIIITIDQIKSYILSWFMFCLLHTGDKSCAFPQKNKLSSAMLQFGAVSGCISHDCKSKHKEKY